MHILYIYQYFCTPEDIGSIRAYEFAKRWVEKGHKITMLTTTAKISQDYLTHSTGRFFKRFSVDGIEVIALSIPYKHQMSLFKRVWAFLSFLITSSLFVTFMKRVDVVYASSTPLTVGVPALVAKWVRRIPFVFEVRDLWPKALIEIGIIRNRILGGILLWLEKRIYENASAIVALSPGMAAGIQMVLRDRQKPVSIIPNSSDIDLFRPDIDGSAIRDEYGWGTKFVLLYAGTMGKINGLDFLVDVADRLKNNHDIHFVMIGRGREKKYLLEKIQRLGLRNIEILAPRPKTELPGFVAACDVSIVIFANHPILEYNSPNKFFDALSAGSPILLNYSGWQREVLEANNAGFGCTQGNLKNFSEKVLYLNSHRKELLEMRQNARRVAEEMFDRDKLAAQALKVINSIENPQST